MEDPHSQYRYQVRFEWGAAGAAAVGNGVDVIVWVDVLDADAEFVPGAADSHFQTIATDPLHGVKTTPSSRQRRMISSLSITWQPWSTRSQGSESTTVLRRRPPRAPRLPH